MPLDHILDLSFSRRIADAVMDWHARWRIDRLDNQCVFAAQEHALLDLVRRAESTRFGQAHDFADILNVEDYQKRVPIRTYEQFWDEWWKPHFPFVQGETWPDQPPYFALSSGTTSGTTKYIPVTREMIQSNQRSAMTALCLFMAAHPGARLFSGRMFFLGGSTDLSPAQLPGVTPLNSAHRPMPHMGDISGIAAAEAPRRFRPFVFPPPELGLIKDWDVKVHKLAEQSAKLPVTAITGVPAWILVLFDKLKQATGKSTIAEIWPKLQVVIHGGTKFEPYAAVFREIVGDDRVKYHEVYPSSEGFLAAQDHRHGGLRPIPNQGIFFEFIPLNEVDAESPTRHCLWDVEPGRQYALAVTTCAGLFSYLIGDTVVFERTDPPILRFTGRTKQFLSAFGEHLIVEEIEAAVTAAAEQLNSPIVDFHVGPVFPVHSREPGFHCYLVEFAGTPPDLPALARSIDTTLIQRNEDYRAHRAGDLSMATPRIVSVPRGGFTDWLRSQGKLGGQHKLPRIDNTGELTADFRKLFANG